MKSKTVTILIVLILVGSIIIPAGCVSDGTLKIGVLLPLTGPDAVDSETVLNWVRDNVNSNGGIKGHSVALVYEDTNGKDITELAQKFIDDKSIKIVVGPPSSSDVYDIAPLFIKHKKILISPFSTSGDVFRAFGGKGYFWRTCQSDVPQVRTIIYLLSIKKVKTLSLIYEDTIYGRTFYDWIGFYCNESAIEVTDMVSFAPGQNDYSQVVSQAIVNNPEYIICAAFPDDMVRIKQELDKAASISKIFCTDSAESAFLIEQLGGNAEGIEGISPSADPTTGFEIAYQLKFGEYPGNFAAVTYDAFLLAAYTLARQEYSLHRFPFFFREGIAESFQKVISGSGTGKGWDKQELNETIALIMDGKLPDINGASGPLEFDMEFGVDPLETYYAHWRIEAGDFRTIETLDSSSSSGIGGAKDGASASRTQAGIQFSELLEISGETYVPEPKQDSWAVIMATDSGWENYRHQADALAMYGLLKKNGFNDDKIILLLTDDIAGNENNSLQGDVHYSVGGDDIRKNAVIDYTGETVTVSNFKNVLSGNKTGDTPLVLETDEQSNVFVYIVDHGTKNGIPFDNGGYLSAKELGETIDGMYDNNKFREIFIMVEACYGENLAANIDTPGVIYFTGSGINEASHGYCYDSEIKAWLADDFSYHFIATAASEPELSIMDLYATVYKKVTGSHVRLVNYNNFNEITTTSISEFLFP